MNDYLNPVGAMIELTSRCNLNCSHCYNANDSRPIRDISDCDWVEVIRNLCMKGIGAITFSGGEPFIRRELLLKLIMIVAEYPNTRIYINTNGTNVPESFLNELMPTYKTGVKYPVLAGGISVRKTASGSVGTMAQLLPVTVDQLGAASVRSGSTRYETADDMQVYLWYKGKYYATTLSQINAEDYSLIGWYDAHGSAAGGKIRVLVAVKKD